MPDYGPNPDRSASGSWGAGESTGVIYLPSDAGFGFNDYHWASIRPIAQMVVAKLGSLSPGQHTVVAAAGNSTEPIIRFVAQRAGGAGNTVSLGFGIKSEFGGAGHYIESFSNSEPWLGAGHEYAWAHHTWSYFDSRASQGTISGKSGCGTTSPTTGNYSGSGHLALGQLPGEPMKVPLSAPGDLRVTYVGCWFNKTSPQAPNDAQFQDRMALFTCRGGWLTGRVRIG